MRRTPISWWWPCLLGAEEGEVEPPLVDPPWGGGNMRWRRMTAAGPAPALQPAALLGRVCVCVEVPEEATGGHLLPHVPLPVQEESL